jgi:preprotein translocase subunit YajC
MMVFESVTLALAQTYPMILFAQETAPPAGNGFGGIFGSPLLPLLVIGVMFYFMLILPERKKRKALEEQLNQLKKNDNVIISGGICGVVVGATAGSKYVTVRVDDTNNTRLRVLRTHILQVGSHDEPETKDVAAKETDKKG